jgi:hypothetical protein
MAGSSSSSTLGLSLHDVDDHLADSFAICLDEVQSAFPVEVFRHFVDVINDNEVEVMKDSVSDLRQLCRELNLCKLSLKLSDFRITELESSFSDGNETLEK